MKSNLLNKLNEQINVEFFASYTYLGMAQWAKRKGLGGLSTWLKEQSDEEREHAEKIMDHLHDLGQAIVLKSINAVTTEYTDVDELLRRALESEQRVSSLFRELYELATTEKEYESIRLIQWFIDEQVEEEKKVEDLITKVKQYKEEQHLLRLDKFIKNNSLTSK